MPSLAQALTRTVASMAPMDPRLSALGQLAVEDAKELSRQIDGFVNGIRYRLISPAPEPRPPSICRPERGVQTDGQSKSVGTQTEMVLKIVGEMEVKMVGVQTITTLPRTHSIGVQTSDPVTGKSPRHGPIFRLVT